MMRESGIIVGSNKSYSNTHLFLFAGIIVSEKGSMPSNSNPFAGRDIPFTPSLRRDRVDTSSAQLVNFQCSHQHLS